MVSVLFWPLTQARVRRSAAACVFILAQAIVMLVVNVLSLQIGLNLFVFGYGFLVVVERMGHGPSGSAEDGADRPAAKLF